MLEILNYKNSETDIKRIKMAIGIGKSMSEKL